MCQPFEIVDAVFHLQVASIFFSATGKVLAIFKERIPLNRSYLAENFVKGLIGTAAYGLTRVNKLRRVPVLAL